MEFALKTVFIPVCVGFAGSEWSDKLRIILHPAPATSLKQVKTALSYGTFDEVYNNIDNSDYPPEFYENKRKEQKEH